MTLDQGFDEAEGAVGGCANGDEVGLLVLGIWQDLGCFFDEFEFMGVVVPVVVLETGHEGVALVLVGFLKLRVLVHEAGDQVQEVGVSV